MSDIISIPFNLSGVSISLSDQVIGTMKSAQWREMMETAEQAQGKEVLSVEETFTVAVAAGVPFRAEFDEEEMLTRFTTAPCGLYRANGKWHAVVNARAR